MVVEILPDTRQIDEAAVKAATEKFAKKNKLEGMQTPTQEIQGKSLAKAMGTTPGKYLLPETSDVKVEVKAESNKICLLYTSDAADE